VALHKSITSQHQACVWNLKNTVNLVFTADDKVTEWHYSQLQNCSS